MRKKPTQFILRQVAGDWIVIRMPHNWNTFQSHSKAKAVAKLVALRKQERMKKNVRHNLNPAQILLNYVRKNTKKNSITTLRSKRKCSICGYPMSKGTEAFKRGSDDYECQDCHVMTSDMISRMRSRPKKERKKRYIKMGFTGHAAPHKWSREARLNAHQEKYRTKLMPLKALTPITRKVEQILYTGNLHSGRKSQAWEHPAERGTQADGLPKGTTLKMPNGKTLKLRANSMLIRNRFGKPTWGKYARIK